MCITHRPHTCRGQASKVSRAPETPHQNSKESARCPRAKVRRILLTNIGGVFAGQEPEGLSTPLDDLCATMIIRPSREMVTFRLEHINARDTFVMCMMLFAQSQGAEMMGLPQEGEPDEEEEDDEVDLVIEDANIGSATGSQA